jgi:hypothetical protein
MDSLLVQPAEVIERIFATSVFGTRSGRSVRSLLILNAAAASFQDPDQARGLSLINDLSAIITASDPSEHRAKLFGIDRGRKRCEVVGSRKSAGASQKRRCEACVEIRQARPKSAREILRQRVIGMLLVFGGTAYIVHVTNRAPRCPLGRKARQDLTMFLRDIEPVIAIAGCSVSLQIVLDLRGGSVAARIAASVSLRLLVATSALRPFSLFSIVCALSPCALGHVERRPKKRITTPSLHPALLCPEGNSRRAQQGHTK